MSKKKPDKPDEQHQGDSADAPKPSESQLEKTVSSDTVNMRDEEKSKPDSQKNQETVPDQFIEQTTEIDSFDSQSASGISESKPISVYRGTDSTSDAESIDKTIVESQQESTVKIARNEDRSSPPEEESVMASDQIGQTVNPRELSDNDVTVWNSAVGLGTQNTDSDSTEIEDSYTERQFERLRQVEVAKLKSDTDGTFDYRLVRELGQGGMGDVFVARQGSLDRLLALKLIKPLSGKKRDQLEKTGKLDSVEEERRQQFLSEAIVTGDLDHPNIVPIHDVGLTSDNQLFYAMKRVVGTPWSDVIHNRSLDENLEILLKASDAIGFAHTRGVVHRDIKPENIMLGDFGVVMVMDWGLALPTSDYEKQDSITATSGLGGTPAFMAPEMASGPIDQIGVASDIYLLGATLFMIITGKPPHFARNVTECLIAVKVNKIRETEPHHQGELMDIALKAMATDPQNRYSNAEAFQAAIRQYRAHAESIALTARAIDDLDAGKQNQSYADLSRARFRFEESLKSWDGNEKAIRGLAETKITHAEAAYKNGDYDLGLSLLDDQCPEHQPLLEELRAGLEERDSRAARLSLLRKVAAAMLAFIILGGSVALISINRQRRLAQSAAEQESIARERAEAAKTQAVAAQQDAINQRKKAEEQEGAAIFAAAEAELQKEKADEEAQRAVEAKQEADKQRDKADKARQVATKNEAVALEARAQAVASQQIAAYEEYVSKIGLAKARLERNEVDGARQILLELKSAAPQQADSWEWRWLWRQANQSQSVQKADAAIIDLSLRDRAGVVALSNGKVRRFAVDELGKIERTVEVPVGNDLSSQPTSVAISPQGTQVAMGLRNGAIVLMGDNSQRLLVGHTAVVSDLQYADDGLLISGSHDKTVRVWDSSSGSELTKNKACWHISPVRQLAVSGSSASLNLAVAIADDSAGRIELWRLSRRGASMAIKPTGTFDQHSSPVTSVAISTNGNNVASGDSDGNVLLWNAADAVATDYAGSLQAAIAAVDGSAPAGRDKRYRETTIAVERLVDASGPDLNQLVSTTRSGDRNRMAHDDVIRSIRFNDLGTLILTASDDNTLKTWSVQQPRLQKTFQGHGGWVVGADFVAETEDIVSASNDATVRSWNRTTYTGSFVSRRIPDGSDPVRQTDAHDAELTSASLSPDRMHIVTTSTDHTARVMRIDPQTLAFTEVARLEHELLQEGSEFVAMSMQLDRRHDRLYVGSADGMIRVWDLGRGVEIGRASSTGLNSSFAISDDGKLMLTGSSSPKAKAILWQLDPEGTSSPRQLHRLKGHDQAVTAMAISNDSRYCFTGDRNGRGFLWDTDSGQSIGEPIDNLLGYRINAAVFNSQGSELLLGADDEQLTRIDLQSRSIVDRLNHDGVVTQVSLAPDGRRLLSLSQLTTRTGMKTTAALWDITSRRRAILDRVQNPDRKSGRRITSVRFDSTGTIASVSRAATSNSPARVRLWDLEDGSNTERPVLVNAQAGKSTSRKAAKRTFRLPAILGTAQEVVPIADHSLLTMNKNAVFRWNVNSKRLVKSYRPHAALTEASFSFDGKRIVTASRSVKVWDPRSGTALGKIEAPHSGPIRTVQFAPKPIGKSKYVFATGGDDRIVRVWSWDDTTNEATMQNEYRLDSVVRRIRFAPDGNRLLMVGDAGLARIQSLDNEDESIDFRTGQGDLASCAFSPDGKMIAVGGSDSKVRLWSLPAVGGQIGEPVVLVGHADAVNDIRLIGDAAKNLRVLTASADDTARVWDPRLGDDTRTGREMLSLRRHTDDVVSIDASDDGGLVMTAGRDGTVILWPVGQ